MKHLNDFHVFLRLEHHRELFELLDDADLA